MTTYPQAKQVPTIHATGARGYTGVMPAHFGELLKRLRASRGWTQDQLAAAAGMSTQSISRAERSPESPLKTSTARTIFEALNRVAPVPPAEAREYFERTGLQGLVDAYTAARASSPSLRAADAFRRYLQNLPDVGSRQAMSIADQLVEELGGDRFHAILRGVLAAEGFGLEAAADGSPVLIVTERTNERGGTPS